MDYSTIQKNKELRAQSRIQLKGVWGKMALAVFIYTVIIYTSLFLFTDFKSDYVRNPLQNPILDLIFTIAANIVSGPFALGFTILFMNRIREKEVSLKNIFEGFKSFPKSFLLLLLQFIFVFLWSLLLIVPGIIKALSYSMCFYILNDNPGMKPIDAINKSKVMMKGYKGKLFLLGLSFIGWYLLGILTLGIGYFWLTPYVGLSMANMYENLKQNQEKAAAGNNSPEEKSE